MDRESRARHQVNTEDHTLYTYRTVPYNLPSMTEPKQCCRRRHFPLQCCGRHQLPYQTNTVRLPPHASGHQQYCGRRHLPYWANMVKPLACLQESTVWQAPTSAIPKEDNATSHVHLTFYSIVGAYHRLVPAGVGSKT